MRALIIICYANFGSNTRSFWPLMAAFAIVALFSIAENIGKDKP